MAKNLLAKRTTIVGTIHGNKRELLKFVKNLKDNMTRFLTKLYKSNHIPFTIYKNKSNKKVFLLAVYNSIQIEKSDKRIPEMIRIYNSTKCGVNTVDQMAKKYSVKSKSCK